MSDIAFYQNNQFKMEISNNLVLTRKKFDAIQRIETPNTEYNKNNVDEKFA